ncbi:MAG: hypothetical protein A2408_01565 [Candidatus Yonathbacteria bacterium RIFOXYC1_FULL_52_10]|uniref:PDZ domain-containing protein n=1 Tax=Candidatus Yonathbacteria bacterium RIFOXYD1_FULL_52_36 TaxID=1802730 RepID=A0A1G2SM76_9BACT|nr:MAG: hypothetical protein A2408_01565 [Candidatus Yonathbacteria bacterium RIFOXYC1_FULL_52_10]OHA85759.1 MAG: hypothetical protein A2591_02735 [Candidatus Yonathbacteria bacterium RIFOXYD1_FULL_52_36]
MQQNPKRLWLTSTLITITVIGLSFGSGYTVGQDRAVQKLALPVDVSLSAPNEVDLSPVWEVWNLIDQKFVSSATSSLPDASARIEGMTVGLVEGLGDPYSVYMPKEESDRFEEEISGNFVGIGVEIGVEEDVLTVIAPLKGTPAERAGLLAGDKIVEIDSVSTYKMDIDDAIKKIRGEVGSTVTLTVLRKDADQPLKLPVVRGVINIPTIDTELRADGVFVVSLYSFSATSPDLFRNALREFTLSGTDKIVLDLRNNPGGYLDAAVDMASWFLPAGKVVAREDFGAKESERMYRSKGYDVFNENLKMAILINEGSASASEILAGALAEHGIATLVGEKSFGKGSVQELIPLDHNGASLKITVAKWLTPNGVSLTKNGLEPTVKIENDPEAKAGDPDVQLERAAEFLKSI